MENLSFLVALLACPLMMVIMFFMMRKMHGTNEHSPSDRRKTEELHKNVSELLEQNKQLVKEIESIKRSR
ncbi:hypothetical protein SAMN05421736_12466 [Evansella caseinilytica]|uniref:Uncharacterized protein n=1 Tax=Evansella caseinilytica TaxID=1503961 RepID=A0A1H3UQD1_9BACI|nr:DUF2933 domain-containing protein [Evansella caseinilytica]SDZ64594.1 hypothetical protein SAMN05421736_12466 [Evansella caseinilytica]